MAQVLISFDGKKLVCLKFGALFHWINPTYREIKIEYIPEQHLKNQGRIYKQNDRISVSYEKYKNLNVHMFGFNFSLRDKWLTFLFNDLHIYIS